MPKLFIIGNGFDKEHGLKTSYWDFRKYLAKYAEGFLMGLEKIYNIAPFERLDKRSKKNKYIQEHHDKTVYETLWKNFKSVSKICFTYLFKAEFGLVLFKSGGCDLC